MSLSIAGKTAIVTGAANGVGRAIARHFADKGANVMFADMDEEGLAREVGQNGAVDEENSNIRCFTGDLREKLTLANLLSATIDAFDRVDVLVNASRQVIRSDPLNPDDDAVEELLQQNLMTSLRLSQVVAKRMIKQAEEEGGEGPVGSIINLSSILASRAHPELMALSISNAALEQMTRSLAVALARTGIRVNAVAMGSVMSASMQDRLKEHPDFRHVIETGTPLGRIASASELAETVQFLASDGAGFMTGQVLTVDGGRTLLDPVTAPAH
ncbi:SDR family NAD(P)-dependent oxidoreductase [Marimonas arenosa]|uniref:SDR family oxidoreductase n=1 Tax=Marimonas arenosa TaxID=1795305 RepID=A0AAE3WEG7_9RHOB|nr:SDR family oxidoreductase [Marimonas arenosa]MDQ2091013.1 SDR family oxidoreductase [Marimonas arenosa]